MLKSVAAIAGADATTGAPAKAKATSAPLMMCLMQISFFATPR
jgi:hypothetical protein